MTTYAYDANTGNLASSTHDPTGAHAVTSYSYGANGAQPNVLSGVSTPDGTTVSFSYDADGNRISKTVTSGATSTTVKDVYQPGLIAYETDGTGTLLATFTDDSEGVPVSVQVGATAPRSYYVYNGHGDVVALVDSAGATVASYAYDTFGVITSSSETFANGWVNPYRYDGRDRVRYDVETGLYWMSVRAYDPTIGRFISRDPLGRAPLFFADQPYVYAGNNPLVNVDPSGQLFSRGSGNATNMAVYRAPVRIQPARPQRQAGSHPSRRDGHPRVLGQPGKQPGSPSGASTTSGLDDNAKKVIAGAILKIGGGLALFGLSLAALIAIANNPEIVAPGTWVASLFGVNLGQAVLKSLSGVTQGLSLFFHGLIDLGGTFNWAKGIRLAIDGVLTVIDPINVLLSALATATRFSSVGNIVGNLYRLVKDVVISNGNALVSMVQTLLDTHKNLGL